MSGRAFRPSITRTQNSMKIFASTKTNATIRDLEEEEGELEEKEGTVVSIKRDMINGAGWTVKDEEENTYICSCASSMYEVPDTVERGGILYPTDTVEVVFTVNPVLKINTIKEIKSLGKETEKMDISKWTHEDESTTVIAKPKSALSISDGLIQLNYDNDNSVLADAEAVKTKGKETSIDTDKLSINSGDIDIRGIGLDDVIKDNALDVSNKYTTYTLDIPQGYARIDTSNNVTQVDINARSFKGYGVIGEIMNQDSIPIKEISQRLITDGDKTDVIEMITIDEDGIIRIYPFEADIKQSEDDKDNYATYHTGDEAGYIRNIQSLTSWMTPRIKARNYIEVSIKQTCDHCDEWGNTWADFINYCPHCDNWSCLVDTSISRIKCTRCGTTYCENCGSGIENPAERLRKYRDNHIIAYGNNCPHCQAYLPSGTHKIYVNYCPDCNEWNTLFQSTIDKKNEETGQDMTVDVMICSSCGKEYCCTCGISQSSYGLKIEEQPVEYKLYRDAFRKLKYITGA